MNDNLKPPGEKCKCCYGKNTIIDPLSGELEAYDCPSCGGSGLAKDELDDKDMLVWALFHTIFELCGAIRDMSEDNSPEDWQGLAKFYEDRVETEIVSVRSSS